MRFLIYLIAPAFFLMTSCARIPEPVGYDYSNQQKMQAGHHWNVLAADIAAEINRRLILSDFFNTPVYVRGTCGDENRPCRPLQATLFDETFRDLLITQLVNLGIPTSSTPSENAITIHYKAQTVYHHTRRLRTIRPGLLTALTAGIVVFRHAPPDVLALATAGAFDFANTSYASNGHFEVIITTSMINRNEYLYRNSNIYYINDQDSWQYQQAGTPTEISLSSPSSINTTASAPKNPAPPPTDVEQPQPLIPQKEKPEIKGI